MVPSTGGRRAPPTQQSCPFVVMLAGKSEEKFFANHCPFHRGRETERQCEKELARVAIEPGDAVICTGVQ